MPHVLQDLLIFLGALRKEVEAMIIKFNFSDADDVASLEFALNGKMYQAALYSIWYHIRNLKKHGDITDAEEKILNDIQDMIPNRIHEHE